MYVEQIQLSILPEQLSKMKRGLTTQTKHGSMGNGDVVVALRPENAKINDVRY